MTTGLRPGVLPAPSVSAFQAGGANADVVVFIISLRRYRPSGSKWF